MLPDWHTGPLLSKRHTCLHFSTNPPVLQNYPASFRPWHGGQIKILVHIWLCGLFLSLSELQFVLEVGVIMSQGNCHIK